MFNDLVGPRPFLNSGLLAMRTSIQENTDTTSIMYRVVVRLLPYSLLFVTATHRVWLWEADTKGAIPRKDTMLKQLSYNRELAFEVRTPAYRYQEPSGTVFQRRPR